MLIAYQAFAVVLDTNLTLLRLAGSISPELVSRWKCTASLFAPTDFVLLQKCLEALGPILTSPHILTEVCHFLEGLDNHYRSYAFNELRQMVGELDERFTPSRGLLRDKAAAVLGLTDTQQLHLASDDRKVCLMSVDAPFIAWAQQRSLPAINFNHIRFQS
jgi:hypothetical protein